MAAEYLAERVQIVNLNNPIIFDASIPCRSGAIYHEDGTGIFILRGITDQCFATYQITYNGNIGIPEGSEVAPIAVAIAVLGEPRLTSRAIYVPVSDVAEGDYGNVTSTAIIKVPRGCYFSVSVEYVSGNVADPAAVPPSSISVIDSNLVIDRIA